MTGFILCSQLFTKMRTNKEDHPGFFETLFGLMLAPGEVTGNLFASASPPHAVAVVCCFLLSVFVPIFAQIAKYGMTVYDMNAVFSCFIVILLGFLFFLLFEGLFLWMCGIELNTSTLFAAIAYCLAPIVMFLWLVYVFNYLSTGSLTLVLALLRGYVAAPDPFLRMIPIASSLAFFMVLVVFFHSLRAMGHLNAMGALLITFFSLFPFVLALGIALLTGELVRQGTIRIFLAILSNPQALTAYPY